MFTTTEIRWAQRHEIDALAATCTDAIAADPVFLWIYGTEQTLRELAPELFRFLLDISFSVGHVCVADDGDAVLMGQPACSLPYGATEMARFESGLRRAGGVCADRLLAVFGTVAAAHPSHARHWHWTFLGVKPHRQGHGLGQTLLRKCSEATGMPCYGEATTERSLTLCRRLGYKAIGELRPDGGCPPLTRVWRDWARPTAPRSTTSWLNGRSATASRNGSGNPHLVPMKRAFEVADTYLSSLPDRPVLARSSYHEMLQALGGPLPAEGSEPAEVVTRLARLAEPGLTAMTGGRFFGMVIGGTHPAALGADWLTSAWDQNGVSTVLAPASAACETVAAGWILDLLGLPAEASVGFVTGGMQANFTCLAAARHGVLRDAGWDVERDGLQRAPGVRVLAGAHRHGTIDLALRYLGFGTGALVEVASDGQGRMRLDALSEALAAGAGPTIVCLQAGDVHTGAFDPLGAAIDLAHEHGAWVHVDGAFGLWAAASPTRRALVEGFERADSWATDGHKTLNVPNDCGFAIVRDPAVHRATFSASAAYLIDSEVGDPVDLVPEFSRRSRGFPVWAVLRSLGRNGVAGLVDRLCRNARRMADGVARLPGVEVLNDVVFTQVLMTFGDDDLTRKVSIGALEEGTAVMTPSTWRGRPVLRCSMSDWSTTDADIDRSVDALARVLDNLR